MDSTKNGGRASGANAEPGFKAKRGGKNKQTVG